MTKKAVMKAVVLKVASLLLNQLMVTVDHKVRC